MNLFPENKLRQVNIWFLSNLPVQTRAERLCIITAWWVNFNKKTYFSISSSWIKLYCLCICSKKNIPVFHLNYERKDLALRVTVNNANGDDAYEAKLVGTFPDMLSYSGVRSHQTTVNNSTASCYLVKFRLTLSDLTQISPRPLSFQPQLNHSWSSSGSNIFCPPVFHLCLGSNLLSWYYCQCNTQIH